MVFIYNTKNLSFLQSDLNKTITKFYNFKGEKNIIYKEQCDRNSFLHVNGIKERRQTEFLKSIKSIITKLQSSLKYLKYV